jgi:hypothetical protein
MFVAPKVIAIPETIVCGRFKADSDGIIDDKIMQILENGCGFVWSLGCVYGHFRSLGRRERELNQLCHLSTGYEGLH